jgi:indolepyruvate decarboxylase
VYATSEQLSIRHHHFHNVQLGDFLNELIRRAPTPPARAIPASLRADVHAYQLEAANPITIGRMIARLNNQIDDRTVVIADIGDALFAATELTIRERTEFISPAYYTSMGFSVPAALGAHFARPDARVLVLVGDGAFQMTGMELSTIARYGQSPIVIVLDNQGYGTERFLHAGNWKYNEIHAWRYSQLPQVLGSGTGYDVRTEGEFDAALNKAWSDRGGFSLIQVHLATDDASTALKRLAERLGRKV